MGGSFYGRKLCQFRERELMRSEEFYGWIEFFFFPMRREKSFVRGERERVRKKENKSFFNSPGDYFKRE